MRQHEETMSEWCSHAYKGSPTNVGATLVLARGCTLANTHHPTSMPSRRRCGHSLDTIYFFIIYWVVWTTGG